jgi:hypothetical protein
MMSSAALNAAVPAVPGITATATTYSKEGLSLSGTTGVTLPVIRVEFGNNLTYQDDILITLPGVTSLVPTPLSGVVACYDPVGNLTPTTAVGYVSLVPGGWNFRVTDINGITIGGSCTFTGLKVTAASLSTTTGKLTYQANRALTTPTVIVDGPYTSATAVVVASQFAIAADTKLNGIVNVYTDRKSFYTAEAVAPGSGATNTKQADTLAFTTYTTGNPAVASFAPPNITLKGATVTIVGDFSWVDDYGPGTGDTGTTCDKAEFDAMIDNGTAPFTGYTVDGTASNCQQLVLVQTVPGSASSSGYFYVPGDVVLSATDWVGNAEWSYELSTDSNVKGKTGVAWDPGAWTMNGAQVYIQYMPYGTGLSRIVYVANRGNLNPVVTADITANGSTFQCPLGTVASKSVVSLATGIDSCVAAKGITTGKVAILLTFIAPDSDIEVYSAYNAGGTDRGTVVNTSNGRSFFYGTGVNFTVTPTP